MFTLQHGARAGGALEISYCASCYTCISLPANLLKPTLPLHNRIFLQWVPLQLTTELHGPTANVVVNSYSMEKILTLKELRDKLTEFLEKGDDPNMPVVLQTSKRGDYLPGLSDFELADVYSDDYPGKVSMHNTIAVKENPEHQKNKVRVLVLSFW